MLNKPFLSVFIVGFFATSLWAIAPQLPLSLYPKRTFPGGVILVRFQIAATESSNDYTLFLNDKETAWELCPNRKTRALCVFAGVEIDGTPAVMKAEIRKGNLLTDVVASGTIPVEMRAYSKKELKVSKAHGEPSAEDLKRGEDERRRLKLVYDASAKVPLWEQPFLMPGKGPPTSFFGGQRLFNGKTASTHYGVDLRGNEKTWVLSANSGKVVFADSLFNSGNFIVLDHGGKIFTTHSHMSKFAVKVGDMVKRGQHLGKIGATGRDTGPHLHWAVRIDGLYVDPLEFLKVAKAVWK